MIEEVCKKYEIQCISKARNLANKVVLLRVDFNVPVSERFEIIDDFRIHSSIETIEYLLSQNAKIILMSHFGNHNESFEKITSQISRILQRNVELCKNLDLAEELIKSHSIILLENIRCFEGEKSNDIEFARYLIQKLTANVYVNEAFSVSHREHASISAVPKLFQEKYAGFSLMNELIVLETKLNNQSYSHITAILGGKKVLTKMKLLKSLTKKVSSIVIVGGMANTFLKAIGINIGNSFYESEMLGTAKEILRDCKVILPIDAICKNDKNEIQTLQIHTVLQESICDIGPKTNALIDDVVSSSNLVIWNGPAGIYEDSRFSNGTKQIATSLLKHNVQSVIGGGDTAAVLHDMKIHSDLFHISNGGGAFIAWLENNFLPGIQSLKQNNDTII